MRSERVLFALAVLAAGIHLTWVGVTHDVDRALQKRTRDERAREDDQAQLSGLTPSTRGGGDLVLVVVDGLRVADLGPDTTPNLQALGWRTVQSSAPEPLGALASLATGSWPSEVGGHPREGGVVPLSREVPTLAERFTEAGYRTLSLSADRQVPALETGLARGFELSLQDSLAQGDRLPYAQGDRLTDLAEQALAQGGGHFVQLRYLDPTLPWIPRQGYVADAGRLHAQSLPRDGERYRRRHRRLLQGLEIDAEVLPSWREAYRAELRFWDEELGRLLAMLGPDDALVVVGSCGQALGEGGRMGTGRGLSQLELAVPLASVGVELPELRSLVELPDALLAAYDLPLLHPEREAPTVARSELRGRPAEDYGADWRERFPEEGEAWLEGSHKLVRADGQWWAWDLALDPEEQQPLGEEPWVMALRERVAP